MTWCMSGQCLTQLCNILLKCRILAEFNSMSCLFCVCINVCLGKAANYFLCVLGTGRLLVNVSGKQVGLNAHVSVDDHVT